jgi:hypothetical protein
MFLIWQRDGGLSSERVAQFAERLLGDFDLVPDEVLELMASLPSSSNDGLSMPLDLGHNSVLLSEGAVVAATALAVIQNSALLSPEDRAALQEEALRRLPEGRQLHPKFFPKGEIQ